MFERATAPRTSGEAGFVRLDEDGACAKRLTSSTGPPDRTLEAEWLHVWQAHAREPLADLGACGTLSDAFDGRDLTRRQKPRAG